jgi:hypothetical protein
MFADDDKVNVTAIDDALIRIERPHYPPVEFVCIKADPLTFDRFESLHEEYPGASFVLVLPRNAIINGSVYRAAEAAGVAVGGWADAMRAARDADPGQYVYRETEYIERILRQHSRVSEFERLDNFRYRIRRRGLGEFVAYIGYNYEITADDVRTAIDRLGGFDAFVTANPNAQDFSPQAMSVGAQANIKIMRWGEFMSALHSA